MPPILRLDHHRPAMAEQILGLLKAAHVQESAAIGAEPEAGQSAAQIQASAHVHLGLLQGDELVGVIVVGADPEAGQLEIKWLAVAAAHQRRGMARALVSRVLTGGLASVAVTVAQANAAALALYQSLGFVAYRWGSLGEHGIAVVKLRRLPVSSGGSQPSG